MDLHRNLWMFFTHAVLGSSVVAEFTHQRPCKSVMHATVYNDFNEKVCLLQKSSVQKASPTVSADAAVSAKEMPSDVHNAQLENGTEMSHERLSLWNVSSVLAFSEPPPQKNKIVFL